MEVIYKDKEKVAFKEVPIGEVFSWHDNLYMKTNELLSANTGELYNAINMSTGVEAYFYDATEVTPVKAQLIIS